jgi:hypothetical protein
VGTGFPKKIMLKQEDRRRSTQLKHPLLNFNIGGNRPQCTGRKSTAASSNFEGFDIGPFQRHRRWNPVHGKLWQVLRFSRLSRGAAITSPPPGCFKIMPVMLAGGHSG